MNETRTRDDLFAPSLSQTSRPDLPAGQRPWRLNSQAYVAFFGGPLAAATIGYLNGRRLGLGQRTLAGIVAAGALAFALAVAVVALLDSETSTPRILITVSGLLAFAITRQLQRRADRRYSLGRPDDSGYDSLVRTGLLVTVVAGFATAAALLAVAA